MAGVIIIGAGPGIGRSIARRFAREGMPIALISRTGDGIPAEVTALGKAAVRTLVDLLDRQFGPAGVHVATVTVAGPVAPGTPFVPGRHRGPVLAAAHPAACAPAARDRRIRRTGRRTR